MAGSLNLKASDGLQSLNIGPSTVLMAHVPSSFNVANRSALLILE